MKLYRAMYKFLLCLALTVSGMTWCVAAENENKDDTLILGVFPHLSAGQLEKVYAPIAAHIAEMLGRREQWTPLIGQRLD